ncbi:MAG: amidohydrolase family protein [Acidimicrobiales bacterium]|nr:amidohydrolase family protein [Acidimicrobiales bacterium]
MEVIDAHLHLFKAVSAAYPRTVYPGMADAEMEVLAEDLLQVMETAGVDKAIVVPLGPQDEYLTDLRDHFPGQFVGIGNHDPESVDIAQDLDRRMETSGIQGIRVSGVDPNASLADDPEEYELFPLFQAMEERGLRVWFYSEPQQVELYEKVLELLPDLVTVFNHSGFMVTIDNLAVDEHRRPHFTTNIPPPTLELLARVAQKSNTYVHFSGQYAFSHGPYPYLEMIPVAEALVGTFGASRMLWASDFPWILSEPGYPEQLALVDHLLPTISDAERNLIRGGTAASLFAF